jgi:hemoglobin-like flavoprotein
MVFIGPPVVCPRTRSIGPCGGSSHNTNTNKKGTFSINVDTNQLRDSFMRIAPHKEEFAATFYQTLLENYPHLRQFFVGVDLKRQQTSLIATLQAMLNESERGETLRTMFRKIGLKHAERLIRAEHYPAFGQTLLETLGRVCK